MVSNKCRIFAEGFLGNVLSNSDNAKTLTILFLFMSGVLGVRLDKQSRLDILVLTNAHSLIEGRRMMLLLLSMMISV